MDKAVLLAEVRATIAAMPDFSTYTPTSRVHLEWMGRVDALLKRWNPIERIPFQTAIYLIGGPFDRNNTYLGQMLSALHRAEADLALDVPIAASQVFGPGAVYDFLKALREVLRLARNSLFVIDPYLDGQVFDTYLSTVDPRVSVRLLAQRYGGDLAASVRTFRQQSEMTIEVRTANGLHDRVVFVDSTSCWVLGQSIKDAAKKSPTYLAPLSADAVSLKLAAYESVWTNAHAL